MPAPRPPSSPPRSSTGTGVGPPARRPGGPGGPRDLAGIVAGAERVARTLDRLVGLPGRDAGIGLDAILGFFLPFVGDLGTGLASLYVIVAAIRARVPPVVIARMLLNIGLDELIGWVPILGDIGDIFFQSNLRNLKLLREHAGGTRSTTGQWLVVGGALVLVLGLIALPMVLVTLAVSGWLGR